MFTKTPTRAALMHANQIPLCSNRPKLYFPMIFSHLLRRASTAEHKYCPLFTVLLIQYISITLFQTDFAQNSRTLRQVLEEQATVNDFGKNMPPGVEVKQVMASFRCYDNSDVIVTSIITNFLLYVTHLCWLFLQVSVKGNVVNAQTWVILPMKNRIEYVIKPIISCCLYVAGIYFFSIFQLIFIFIILFRQGSRLYLFCSRCNRFVDKYL